MEADYRHRPGAHCGSTSLRNLSDHYGWGFDEAECFGLGAGVGFSYSDDGPADRMIMGRAPHLESAFFEHLGIAVTDTAGQDRAAAWDALAERVAEGPVLVFVDLGYLPYFGTETHFGPHTILVTAIEGERVTVSDSEFDDPQTVDRDAFDRAWSSDQGFGPLERRWLAVDDPAVTATVETATRDAIERACRSMREGGDGCGSQGGDSWEDQNGESWGTQGVAGIRAFAEALPDWNALDDPKWTARFAYQNIERRGTGGGAFRHLYADFLDSLGTEVGPGSVLADRTYAVADDWTTVAMTLQLASEEAAPADRRERFETAAAQVGAIADEEAALFEDLAAAV